MEQTKYDVFISYSRKDTKVADQIAQAFEDAGISYFIDRQGIGGGMEFPAVLAKAIRESRVFLFLASKNSYDSKFTQSEIVYAFNKKHKRDIIPYIIDDSSLPEELEFTFSAINWRRMSQHPIETVLVEDVLRKIGKQRDNLGQKGETDSEKYRQGKVYYRNNWFEYLRSHFTGKWLAFIVFSLALIYLLWAIIVSKAFILSHFNAIEVISFLCLLVSLGFLIVGLIRPASVCLNNRKEVSKYYLSSLIFIIIVFGIIASNEPIEVASSQDNKGPFCDSIAVSNDCDFIDLGLPSGTLWGDRNVGAQSPSDFGDLYAWGEIVTKEDYSRSSYVEETKPTTKITTVQYDAATAVLGEEWKLPTEAQFKELITECTWIWKKVDGHNGYEIVGKNGNSIFLPASGWSCDTTYQYRNHYGYYWTSERSANAQFARSLQFPKEGRGIVGNGYKYVGRSIRAVYVFEVFAD